MSTMEKRGYSKRLLEPSIREQRDRKEVGDVAYALRALHHGVCTRQAGRQAETGHILHDGLNHLSLCVTSSDAYGSYIVYDKRRKVDA
jgi:hypothetical protein